jgi:hypothetical protein
MKARWPTIKIDAPDLALAAAVATAAVVAVLMGAPPFVRVVLTLPLVFFIPGYVLLHALLPASSLATVERLAIAVGASIAITILAGLLLGWAPVPLGSLSWSVTLGTISVIGAAVCWVRRRRLSSAVAPPASPSIRMRDGLTVAVAGLAAVAILAGTRAIASDMEPPHPVQLWMLPVANESYDAHLGVRGGLPSGTYTVRVSSSGVTLNEFPVTVGPGETWETVLSFSQADRQRPIVARLYEQGQDVELRFVVLQPRP